MGRGLLRAFGATVAGAAVLVLGVALPARAGAPRISRNVLVIVIDDLGLDFWPDHPVTDGPPVTPRLDQIAAQGVVFDQAWASPYCSASRAQAITGRTAAGTGVYGPNPYLQSSECTLPEALAAWAPSYARAVVGKWHITIDNPLNHGIQTARLTAFPNDPTPWRSGWIDYYAYSRYRFPESTVENLDCNPQLGGDGSCYATSTTIDDAIAWIQSKQAIRKPWFLWLGLNAIHFPFQAPPDGMHGQGPLCASPPCAGRYPSGGPYTPRRFAKAMLEALDTELERLFLATGIDPTRNTHVLVIGDNGTDPNAQSLDTPFRGHKGTTYEGGIRVPIVLAAPAVPPAQRGTRSSDLVHVRDTFATVLDALGVPLTRQGGNGDCGDLVAVADQPGFDSVSLFDVIAGQATWTTLYTDGANHNFGPGGILTGRPSAVRDVEGHKLVCPELPPSQQGSGVLATPEAYHLPTDLAETTDRIDDPSLQEALDELRPLLLPCGDD
jgi:arylsulfatase A-like enzyme